MMNIHHSVMRCMSVCALALVTLLAYTADARAASFQIVKIFDTPLVGPATFEFTIEKKVSGVWIEVPCIDDWGSCTLVLSDLPTGSRVVLAQSSAAWFTDGDYYIREVSPIGWFLDDVEVVGGTNVHYDSRFNELYFSFSTASLEEDGYVALHNVGPFTDPSPVPKPSTLALFGLAAAAASVRSRRRRDR